jgi:hypothetical protein
VQYSWVGYARLHFSVRSTTSGLGAPNGGGDSLISSVVKTESVLRLIRFLTKRSQLATDKENAEMESVRKLIRKAAKPYQLVETRSMVWR